MRVDNSKPVVKLHLISFYIAQSTVHNEEGGLFYSYVYSSRSMSTDEKGVDSSSGSAKEIKTAQDVSEIVFVLRHRVNMCRLFRQRTS